MKRTPLKRRKRPMLRRSRIRQVNPRRAKERRENADHGYRERVRALGCVFASFGGCFGPVDFCHVKTRATGGQDVGNGFPACRGHHTEQHTIGFGGILEKYGVDLADVARTIALDMGLTPDE